MVGELVHRAGQRGPRIVAHGLEDALEELVAVLVEVIALVIGVLLHAREEETQRLHEGVVVHQGVPLRAVEPGLRGTVVLGDQDAVGVDLLDAITEATPELVVELLGVAQVCSHVQTPAVHAVGRLYPMAGDVHDLLLQLLGLLVVELGQGLKAAPAVVG